MTAATLVGSLGFFLWISLGLASKEYRALYRGVDTKQAATITEERKVGR